MGSPDNIVRAVPEISFKNHGAFINALRNEMDFFKRWRTQQFNFPDGTPYLRFIKPEDVQGTSHAILPVWFSSPTGESLLEIGECINALLRVQAKGNVIADGGVSVLFPYMEARMDKPSQKNGVMTEGEAVLTEVLAPQLAGVSNIDVLGLHSYEAQCVLENTGAEVMNISPMPLFVAKAQETGIINENTVIVALDLGSLQGVLHFAKLAGMDVKNQVIIFDKGARDQDGKKSGLQLIYGQIGSRTNAIIIDDCHDTGGSLDDAEDFLVKKGINSIFQFLVHGIFSYPADKKVEEREKREVVKKTYVTDSLPQAKFRFEDSSIVEVIPVAKLLAWMAVTKIDHSLETLMETPWLQDYIMLLKDKHEVLKEFLAVVK